MYIDGHSERLMTMIDVLIIWLSSLYLMLQEEGKMLISSYPSYYPCGLEAIGIKCLYTRIQLQIRYDRLIRSVEVESKVVDNNVSLQPAGCSSFRMGVDNTKKQINY